MSEHQYVAFRAIDSPVSKKELAYMRRQSTRAEITPWSFVNEYHYGDFRGNALEMLRRGYDFHLHYANFGIRSLFIRLPQGFPDSKASKPYLLKESLRFIIDRESSGGILAIEPRHEPNDLEELWDFDPIFDQLIPLRSELLNGDLRPLYLAHLVVSCDIEHDPEKTIESPVPAGLHELSDAQTALAQLYEISGAFVAAAAQQFAPLPGKSDSCDAYADWLRAQPQTTKDAWLAELMSDTSSEVRTQILAKYRNDRAAPAWPTIRLDRTIAELQATAAEIQRNKDVKSAAAAKRKRAQKLVKMAADPATVLKKTEQLVAQRTTEAYEQVGQLLSDLREALTESGGSELAERQALKLKQMNPTLRHLTAALRRQGFVPK